MTLANGVVSPVRITAFAPFDISFSFSCDTCSDGISSWNTSLRPASLTSFAYTCFSAYMLSATTLYVSSNDGVPGLSAMSIRFTPSGIGRPQSPITIQSPCPSPLRTFDISLFKTTDLYIVHRLLPLAESRNAALGAHRPDRQGCGHVRTAYGITQTLSLDEECSERPVERITGTGGIDGRGLKSGHAHFLLPVVVQAARTAHRDDELVGVLTDGAFHVITEECAAL